MNQKHSWRLPMTFLIGALMVALAVYLQIPDSVMASISCQGQTTLFAGTDSATLLHYGVRANITVRNPSLCGSNHSRSEAWVLTFGTTAGGWAQVGYIKWPGYNSPLHFAEYQKNSNPGSDYAYKEGGAATGSPLYTVKYIKSTGLLYMYVGSSTLLTSSFDPTIAWGSPSTWEPEYEGETHDNGDDMPGTATSQTYFQNMAIKTSVNTETWTAPSGLTVSSDSSRYSAVKDSNSQMRIWTK